MPNGSIVNVICRKAEARKRNLAGRIRAHDSGYLILNVLNVRYQGHLMSCLYFAYRKVTGCLSWLLSTRAALATASFVTRSSTVSKHFGVTKQNTKPVA